MREKDIGRQANKISSELMSMTNRTWEEGGRRTVQTMNRNEREIRLQPALSAVSAPLTNGQPLLTVFDGSGIFQQICGRIHQVQCCTDFNSPTYRDKWWHQFVSLKQPLFRLNWQERRLDLCELWLLSFRSKGGSGVTLVRSFGWRHSL